MTTKEQELLDTLNEMISLCVPFKYDDFNHKIPAKDNKELCDAEKRNPKMGIITFDDNLDGISTLSIIATITDILIDKRLAFKIDNDGYIIAVQWFNL